MNHVLTTQSLTRDQVQKIWTLAEAPDRLELDRPAALSLSGMGTRTRTTFVQALRELGLEWIELPGFLETDERPEDLAGYLDPFYSLYIIRFQDHEKLERFARASKRPVINAMSGKEHPCEALADAYWFHTQVKPLDRARIVLFGPATNVLTSWHHVAVAAGAAVIVVDAPDQRVPEKIDLVVTDSPPPGYLGPLRSLKISHLERMGLPVLLPTPPFTIGKELAFDPVTYSNFAGYEEKVFLLTMQKAIIRYAFK